MAPFRTGSFAWVWPILVDLGLQLDLRTNCRCPSQRARRGRDGGKQGDVDCLITWFYCFCVCVCVFHPKVGCDEHVGAITYILFFPPEWSRQLRTCRDVKFLIHGAQSCLILVLSNWSMGSLDYSYLGALQYSPMVLPSKQQTRHQQDAVSVDSVEAHSSLLRTIFRALRLIFLGNSLYGFILTSYLLSCALFYVQQLFVHRSATAMLYVQMSMRW